MQTRLRCCAVVSLLLSTFALAPLARAQEAVYIIVPQARTNVIAPHPRPDPHPRPSVSLTAVNSHITIDDQIATTTLVLTLTNSSNRQLEAQILLPVPEGASVRSFQLDSLGSEPTAKLLPRDEARRIYDEIVRRVKDPGLLEFAGHNQIRSSVFPIPANGSETVRLTYEHLLGAEGERIDYALPRSEAEAGHAGVPTVKWSISAELKASRPIATVYSSSHDITTKRHSPSHLTVTAASDSLAKPGAFALSYLLEASAQDGIAATLMAYPDATVADGKGGYFMMLAALPAAKNGSKGIKREVTIVIDRSGSMSGVKMDQAREAARQVIEGLDDGEAFNIVDFSSDVQMFARSPVIKDAKSIEAVRGYLGTVRAAGGTNIHDAILAALRQEPTAGMLPVVLFLTDGLATVGRTGEREIREAAQAANVHERRIFTFGVGYDVNAPLLSAMAREARAVSTFVLPQEDVEVKVGQVYRRLSGPVLASPKLTVIDAQGKESTRLIRELQPAQLPDVFEGDQIILLGQYTEEGAIRVHLEGNYRGDPHRFEITFDTAEASTRHAHVPRLWASRKIAALIESIRMAGADGRPLATNDPKTKELVDEIVRLSIKYGILTEYTAFLATEPGDGDAVAFVPAAEARERFASDLGYSLEERSGSGGVARQRSADAQMQVANVGQLNLFYDSGQRMQNLGGVQYVGDRTLFRRGNRWVDAQLVSDEKGEAAEPEMVIEFGSPEHTRLLEQLTSQNLQGLLANIEDTYLLVDGQRVLVKGPS